MGNMRNAEIGKSNRLLQYDHIYLKAQENSSCNGVDNISINVHQTKSKKRKKYKVIKYARQTQFVSRLCGSNTWKNHRLSITKTSSMPKLNTRENNDKPQLKQSYTALQTGNNQSESKYLVNLASEHRKPDHMNPFFNPHIRTRLKVFRCQLNTNDESCCCSCNSDAMFEVMKSLYDCYKKKDCNNCNCILCGHLPRQERSLGEQRKSMSRVTVGVGADTAKELKKKKEKLKKAEKAMVGKTTAEKEKIMRDLVKSGVSLPEAKTASEKALVQKLKTEYGIPPEPKTLSEKHKMMKAEAAGLITPLSGKTPSEKENILRKQAEMGIILPAGRTPSEKALIEKVKTTVKAPSAKIPSVKWRKAKAEGLLTPLDGKTTKQKEQILRGLAMQGLPLPEGKTDSERKLIDKVRADVGLPPEPRTRSMKNKYSKAVNAGLMVPLEGKSPSQKEIILQGLANKGIPLPEGRTNSEKALIEKIKAKAPSAVVTPSKKLRKAKEAGLLTPLEGKTPEQKEKLLEGLAKQGILLPEGKTASEKKLIDKVRARMGLPPEPKSASMRDKYNKAADAGLMVPLEGKSPSQKEKILQGLADMGIPLPEGRKASEKSLIARVKARARPPAEGVALSEKVKRAQAAGLLTPLEGKTPEQKEKILRGLAKQGVPLPELKTASEKKLAEKIRTELGLPTEPKSPSEKAKYKQALEAGILTPLDGKSPSQKERILRGQQNVGLLLPEGRTPSEKDLIEQIKASKRIRKSRDIGSGPRALPPVQRKKLDEKTAKNIKEGTGPVDECICGLLTPESDRNAVPQPVAKAAGLLTPLEGKTASEKALIAKIKSAGAPSITSEKLRKAKTAGLLTPLEGKTPEQKEIILKGLAKTGLPLPEGKTASEKALILKIKTAAGIPDATESDKMRKAKAAGILTSIEGKTMSQKEKILRGRAAAGFPLPEGKTTSEKELVKKIKAQTGYVSPTPSSRMKRAKATGLMTPLEGKTISQKAKIVKERLAAGLPPPEGKTPSEKEMIRKITAAVGPPPEHKTPSEKMRRAKAAGLLTPLEGKTPEQKEKIIRGLVKAGVPLPEPMTVSERNLIDKVRQETGLPPEPKTPSLREKYQKAQAAGIITPLQDKTISQKEMALKKIYDAGIPLPEGRTASEKALIQRVQKGLVSSKGRVPSEKFRAAKAAGLLTPLAGKTLDQKEKILKGLAKAGIPLPEAKTASEKALIMKVRSELRLPPEPQTESEKIKLKKAQAAGLITPLEGKTASQKEKVLRNLAEAGVALPTGRTPSEKAMVSKIQAEVGAKAPTGRLSRMRIPYALSPEQAQKLDEKTIITTKVLSEKLRKAKAAGLLTPLKGKTAKEKERILKGLAQQGLPLPEAVTSSEKKMVDKVRKELGLPPEPETASEWKRFEKAIAAGKIVPLEGKSPSEKVRILKSQAAMRIILPEGRTPSEKALIEKVKTEVKVQSKVRIPSEKIRKAKAAGLITPLKGKSSQQKDKILKGIAMQGLPLPEGKTASEKKLVERVRAELGLPPEPKTASEKFKYEKAVAAGIIEPLEGKTLLEKKKTLRAQADMGLSLPEGRTPSEKSLIAKIKAESKAAPFERLHQAKTRSEKEKILKSIAGKGMPLPEGKTPSEKALIRKYQEQETKRPRRLGEGGPALPLEKARKLDEKTAKVMKGGKGPADECICDLLTPESDRITRKVTIKPVKISSEKIRKAKAAGLFTPLEGKTVEKQEEILKSLAAAGVPLPEPKTTSEKRLIEKVRTEIGLPPEPKTQSERNKYEKGVAAGIIVPLEGKTGSEKAKILRAQAEAGIPLPEGRTPSEKALIAKVKAESKALTKVSIPSEKILKAKAAGLLTPLEGKSASEKEKILKGLAMQGLPLPEGKTASERKLIDKVRKDLGLPPEPKTASEKLRYDKAIASGVIVPLAKLSPAMKEKTLRAQAELGLTLPEGRTASEKALISKVITESKAPFIVPSDKLRKAKAAGLLTPMEGKSAVEKEKIIRGLAEMGMPLPEGKTKSEKSIIHKIRTEHGIPPPARTTSEKELIREAKAEGLFTPLAGKSTSQKERILKGLAEAGLPIPEGKTKSEKELVKKIRVAAGLQPEATLSEKKGGIKTKSKRVGITGLRRSTKGIGARRTKVEGISEEFEDIVKTTTCERGCGCDRKKIRFKHSYVKIKVTSPDISSLCPCPNECIPGVKGGIFTDNEGIKVTIGSAVGVPWYLRQLTLNSLSVEEIVFDLGHNYKPSNCSSYAYSSHKSKYTKLNSMKIPKNHYKDEVEYIYKYNTVYTSSDESVRIKANKVESRKSISYLHNSVFQSNYSTGDSDAFLDILCKDTPIKRTSETGSLTSSGCSKTCSRCSFDSLLIIKSETSLSLTTASCNSLHTNSFQSFVDSEFTSNSRNNLCYSTSENSSSNMAVNESDYFKDIDHKIDFIARSYYLNKPSSNANNKLENVSKNQNRYQILRTATSKIENNAANSEDISKVKKTEPVILINDVNSELDIVPMMNELLSSREFSGTSSIYVVVSSSDDSASDTNDSTICLRTSDKIPELANSIHLTKRKSSIACTLKISRTPKSNFYKSFTSPKQHKTDVKRPLETSLQKQQDYKQPHGIIQTKQPNVSRLQETSQKNKPGNRSQASQTNTSNQTEETSQRKEDLISKLFRITVTKKKKKKYNAISTDTTQDRPCCCPSNDRGSIHVLRNYGENIQCVASVMSELIIPMMNDNISLGMPTTDLCLPIQTTLSTQNRNIPETSVIICRVPPCSGTTECHHNDDQMRQFVTYKPCPPRQLKLESTLNSEPERSVACGTDDSNTRIKANVRVLAPTEKYTQSTPCSNPEPKINNGKKKKVQLRPPNAHEAQHPPLSGTEPGDRKDTSSIGCQCCRCVDAQTGTEQSTGKDVNLCTEAKIKMQKEKCVCKNRPGKKNKIICECPEMPEPEPEIDYIAYEDYDIDLKGKWKMQSELTQTTSGFKINMKKRQELGSEMSFEDALAYYASIEIDPEVADSQSQGEDCNCEEERKKKKKAFQCECPEAALFQLLPPVDSEPIALVEEPLKGFKLTIGGKGSASKGLTGVCCFDMYESNTYMAAYMDKKDSNNKSSFTN